jgi:hypothetical protein
VVYRAGRWPKEAQELFSRLDTDHDGQIGLYEWRYSGQPLQDFFKMDRNGDGFLTVEEYLRHIGADTKKSEGVTAAAPAPGNSRSGASARGNLATVGNSPASAGGGHRSGNRSPAAGRGRRLGYGDSEGRGGARQGFGNDGRRSGRRQGGE